MVVLIAGAVYSAILGDSIRFFPDEMDYINLAAGLALGNGYTLDGVLQTAYRPPIFPFFLAILQKVGAGLPAMRMLGFLAYVLALFFTGVIVYETTEPETNGIGLKKRAGWSLMIASALGIGYPILFFTAGAFYPQSLASLLLVLLLYLINRNFPTPRSSQITIFIGFIAGILSLTVPTFVVIILFIYAWQIFTARFDRRVVISVALSTAMMFSVIGIWTLRNAILFKDFVLISTNSGDNLIRGNADEATPNSGPGTDVERYMQVVENLGEVARDRALQGMVFQIWFSEPIRSINLYFGKVLNYFNFRNDLVTKDQSSEFRDLVQGVSYYLILLLAIWRLAAWRRFPLSHLEKMAAGIYLFNAFYSAIVFTRIRYRLPFDYLVIFLAAVLLKNLIQHRKELLHLS